MKTASTLDGQGILIGLALVGVTFGFWKIGDLICLAFTRISFPWT